MAKTKAEAVSQLIDLMKNTPEFMDINGSTKDIFILPSKFIYDEGDTLKWYLRFVSDCDPSAVATITAVDKYHTHYEAKISDGWKITTVIRKGLDNAGD